MNRLTALFLLLCAAAAAQTVPPVKVWQGELTIPTNLEGPPNVNPPFDSFSPARSNYPYTLRESITAQRQDQRWRALFLENEYLKCSVLPDIGGHLYSCLDKTNGMEMFYANRTIKRAQVGYRGAWAAFGIEFNFPVSHNWASMSPVDFAALQHPDGSASVWVANRDRVYSMQWRVELILRPGSQVLEERIRLFNPSPIRHRFYWWNNAAAEVWDDTRIIYPQHLSASHGFTFVDTWPVNQAGLDLSVVKNHTAGPVSQFTHRSREPYMAVYHPSKRAGLVHFAYPDEVPAKKIWAWGVDADGLDWRKALSDDNSAYVEIQGGLFRNQETYAFLQPQETLEFREFWIPVRDLGGIARANLKAVVNIDRSSTPRLALQVTEKLAGARLEVIPAGSSTPVLNETLNLSPTEILSRPLPAQPVYTVRLRDAAGRTLLEHTEGRYDADGPDVEKPGPRPARKFAPAATRPEGEFLEIATDEELNGRLLPAWQTYQDALAKYPASYHLKRAAGRLAVHLMRYDEAARYLTQAQTDVTNDPETNYYLGLALAAQGREADARVELQRAFLYGPLRAPAALELARLAARAGDFEAALTKARAALSFSPQSTNAGWLEVVALKKLNRPSEADARLRHYLALDPTSALLQLEASSTPAALWRHLAAEPERLLDIVTEYIEAGLNAQALPLLERQYPAVDPIEAEPASVRPQEYPLITYYRGFCRERLGQSAAADYKLASSQSLQYVFPSRPGTLPVLNAALRANPNDASAHFLLGSLYMAGGRTTDALNEWQRARQLNPRIPVLHRNLGLTLLLVKGDTAAAAEALREGLPADPKNSELYSGLMQALYLLGRPAAERVQVLQRYPDPAAMPNALVYSLALSLTEAQRFEEAEKQFQNRFFSREEGGTNVRQVYLEVQLQKALAAAKAGRKAEALATLDALGKPVPGLDFTKDGFESLLRDARVQSLIAEAESLSGRQAEATRRLTALVSRTGGRRASSPVFSYRAARKLNLPAQTDLLAQLKTIAAADASAQPGIALYHRGLALQETGHPAEARAAFESAIKAADRNLSLYLSGEALATLR